MSRSAAEASRRQFRVPILLAETAGLARRGEPVRLGIPFPRGLLAEATRVAVVDASGQPVRHQSRALAQWPDGSVKWLLLDALASAAPLRDSRLFVVPGDGDGNAAAGDSSGAALEVRHAANTVVVSTGAATFEVGAKRSAVLDAARLEDSGPVACAGAWLDLIDSRGNSYRATFEEPSIEEQGPVRTQIALRGRLRAGALGGDLSLNVRLLFAAGMAAVGVEVLVRNPRAAAHPGGLWDLADAGAAHFEDLSLRVDPPTPVAEPCWSAEPFEAMQRAGPGNLVFYQDSSGGENWDSDNHVDAAGAPSVAFRGYRVTGLQSGAPALLGEGPRATPRVAAGGIALTALDFWQSFPKSLRIERDSLSVGLFPGECRKPFALQGGEQKRHTVWLELVGAGEPTWIPRLQRPLEASVDPLWIEESAALMSFVAESRDHNEKYLQYVRSIIEGPHCFAGKRELIDEYGWRNFGDLYADHEAVGHDGPRPMVSHYNNQYDFIHGALVHFLRTGDARWRRLGTEAARHTIDIDIYHTDADRPAFNHGMFWHTDHYKPAATCTHRTYSRHNGRGRRYGGGPSCEHNYTSGLLLYHYLTGDPEGAAAVLELADWVIAMDDGERTLLGFLDAGPTGLASSTVDGSYHKPGRGAGNSINALLDGYQLSRKREYLAKAEEMVCRCVHPRDDLEALHLDEPEYRWSYLVFLQVLGKYLECKTEWGEADYMFHYARESLLHYASWVATREVPYKEVLHKVELPTETWPAHDVRKAHVLHLAAKYAGEERRAAFHARAAFFFDRCIEDVLSFPTAHLTRPRVILCVVGYVHSYFQANSDVCARAESRAYSYGEPVVFVPQRRRLKSALRRARSLLAAHLARSGAALLTVLRRRRLGLRAAAGIRT